MDTVLNTVWKFHDISITQILREINFWGCTSAKSTIITHLDALNFDSYEVLHFLKAEILFFANFGALSFVDLIQFSVVFGVGRFFLT